MSEQSTAEPMAYIGRTTCCGHIVAAIVDDERSNPREVAKTVAGFIRDGLVIGRVTCEAVRAAPDWGCKCEKPEPAKRKRQAR
jgi:hypothetical protein